MKKINFLFIFLTYIFIVGCVRNKIEDENTHKISVDLSASKNMKEDIESLQVMKLEEDENNFPGVYSKVDWKGDSMYILDTFKSRGLYLYDAEGKLIGFYNKVGQGPDEFQGLSDFILMDDGAILLDTYSKSNRIYIDSNFKFLRKEGAEEKAAHFAEDGNGGFWYDRGNIAYGDNKAKLVYVSERKRESVLDVPKNLENVTFSNSNSFSRLNNDTVAYLPVLEPYVYKCHKGKAIKWLEFDFGDKWPVVDAEASAPNPLSLMRKIADEGKIYGLNMDCDGGYMVFSFNSKDRFYIMLLKQDDPDSVRMLHIENSELEKLGEFLSMHNGYLYFGGDGKIVKVELKSIS